MISTIYKALRTATIYSLPLLLAWPFLGNSSAFEMADDEINLMFSFEEPDTTTGMSITFRDTIKIDTGLFNKFQQGLTFDRFDHLFARGSLCGRNGATLEAIFYSMMPKSFVPKTDTNAKRFKPMVFDFGGVISTARSPCGFWARE